LFAVLRCRMELKAIFFWENADGMYKWYLAEWRLVLACSLCFALAVLLLFPYYLAMLFLSRPYQWEAVTAVFLSFNLFPMVYLVFWAMRANTKAFENYVGTTSPVQYSVDEAPPEVTSHVTLVLLRVPNLHMCAGRC
jgi:hypothetical protein